MRYAKAILKIIIITLLGTALSACSKGSDDDNNPSGSCNDCSFSATVTGADISAYTATTAKAVWTKRPVGSNPMYAFYVAGEDKPNKRLLHFFVYATTAHQPGTYQIRLSNGNQGIYIENYDASGEKGWLAPGPTADPEESFGTVTITDITDTRAKGTFSFTSYENVNYNTTRTVTNGSFDVPLTRQGF